MVMFLEANSI